MNLRARLAKLEQALDQPQLGEIRMGPLEMLLLEGMGLLVIEPPYSRELLQLMYLIERPYESARPHLMH